MFLVKDNNSRFVIIDSSVVDTQDISQLEMAFAGDKIYEVIRYIDGRPLFLEDHYKRLSDSAILTGIDDLISIHTLKELGKVLLEINDMTDCNLKIIFGKDNEGNNTYILYLSVFSYPNSGMYKKGVTTKVIEERRDNPNAKVSREEYIKRISEFREKHNVYEALLKNMNGFLLEGSRSNLFFVKGNTVYTAPTETVLVGTMRKYVLKACENLAIKFSLEAISYENLDEFDAAFLTGTSIKILPIAKIDDKSYNSSNNDIVLRLMKGLEQIIKEYYNLHN